MAKNAVATAPAIDRQKKGKLTTVTSKTVSTTPAIVPAPTPVTPPPTNELEDVPLGAAATVSVVPAFITEYRERIAALKASGKFEDYLKKATERKTSTGAPMTQEQRREAGRKAAETRKAKYESDRKALASVLTADELIVADQLLKEKFYAAADKAMATIAEKMKDPAYAEARKRSQKEAGQKAKETRARNIAAAAKSVPAS